jgi:hypothetical protein
MSALLPALAFAVVIMAQFASVIAARAVTQDTPGPRGGARTPK